MTFSFHDGFCVFFVYLGLRFRFRINVVSCERHRKVFVAWHANFFGLHPIRNIFGNYNRYTHCSREKQNSSKTWINLSSYDTINETVKHSVTLLTVCVGKFCILMSSILLYPRISRTPNFERFFLEKSAAYTWVNTVFNIYNTISNLQHMPSFNYLSKKRMLLSTAKALVSDHPLMFYHSVANESPSLIATIFLNSQGGRLWDCWLQC